MLNDIVTAIGSIIINAQLKLCIIRIIREAYENHLRNHSFIEDIRGYGV